MFQKQFSLIASEEKVLKELSVFAIQVHIEAWFTASKAIETPHCELFSNKAFLIQHLKRCLNIYGICLKS